MICNDIDKSISSEGAKKDPLTRHRSRSARRHTSGSGQLPVLHSLDLDTCGGLILLLTSGSDSHELESAKEKFHIFNFSLLCFLYDINFLIECYIRRIPRGTRSRSARSTQQINCS